MGTVSSVPGYSRPVMDSGRTGPIEITRAGPDRLGILAPLFGHAFVDDPMMGWTLGEPPRSPDRYIPCFAAFLERALPHGVVWEGTAHGDAGTAVGAAVWIPPGRFEKWAEHPWNQPRILELTDDGGRRYNRFWQWVDEHSPTEPAWLLDSVAVEPAVQGRGFGSELITAGLDRARTDGQGAVPVDRDRAQRDHLREARLPGREGDRRARPGSPHLVHALEALTHRSVTAPVALRTLTPRAGWTPAP